MADYYYEDFTEVNYRRLLKILAKKYTSVSYDYSVICNHSRELLLRHDVDFSLNRALSLAQIENEEGVRSTYFIYPHCEFYNIWESSQYEIIREIAMLGHDIGLHFDHQFYSRTKDLDFEQLAVNEKNFLENIFDVKISAISFHNPETNGTLGLDSDYYGGMVNAYSKTIKDTYKYCSDSNGYWRYDRLEDVIISDKYDKLHILLHPEWWVKKQMSPYERIKRCVEGRARNALDNYNEAISLSGRKNVGFEED